MSDDGMCPQCGGWTRDSLHIGTPCGFPFKPAPTESMATLRTQLSAAQAQSAALREALQSVAPWAQDLPPHVDQSIQAALSDTQRAAEEYRASVLEEAAKVCDESAVDWKQDAEHYATAENWDRAVRSSGRRSEAESLAVDIRALKSSPPEKP